MGGSTSSGPTLERGREFISFEPQLSAYTADLAKLVGIVGSLLNGSQWPALPPSATRRACGRGFREITGASELCVKLGHLTSTD